MRNAVSFHHLLLFMYWGHAYSSANWLSINCPKQTHFHSFYHFEENFMLVKLILYSYRLGNEA